MKVIYIAGPFRGPNTWDVEKNIRRAEELAFEVNSLGGCIALCPHTNTRFFNGTLTDEFWLDGTKELLRRCDAVMFRIDWTRSSGSRDELKLARSIGMPCFSELVILGAWIRGDEVHAHRDWSKMLIVHERELFTVGSSEVGQLDLVLR